LPPWLNFLHVSDDGLVVAVQTGVFLPDVLVRHAFAFQVGAQDLLWCVVHIVGAQQHQRFTAASLASS
jgi:hypothetical protein